MTLLESPSSEPVGDVKEVLEKLRKVREGAAYSDLNPTDSDRLHVAISILEGLRSLPVSVQHPETLTHEDIECVRTDWPVLKHDAPYAWYAIRFPDGRSRTYHCHHEFWTLVNTRFEVYREVGCAIYRRIPAEPLVFETVGTLHQSITTGQEGRYMFNLPNDVARIPCGKKLKIRIEVGP